MKNKIKIISAALLLTGAVNGYCGGKKIICVLDLEDKSNHSHSWQNVGTGVAEMLVTALSDTKKYTLIERSKLLKYFSLPTDFPKFPPVPPEIAGKYSQQSTGPPDDGCQLVPAAELPACR